MCTRTTLHGTDMEDMVDFLKLRLPNAPLEDLQVRFHVWQKVCMDTFWKRLQTNHATRQPHRSAC